MMFLGGNSVDFFPFCIEQYEFICKLTIIKVNSKSSVSILVEITFLITPYKIFLNDSNGHGWYIFLIYYYNLWIIHVQSPTNLPKSMWKPVFNVVDVIFKFENLKKNPPSLDE